MSSYYNLDDEAIFFRLVTFEVQDEATTHDDIVGYIKMFPIELTSLFPSGDYCVFIRQDQTDGDYWNIGITKGTIFNETTLNESGAATSLIVEGSLETLPVSEVLDLADYKCCIRVDIGNKPKVIDGNWLTDEELLLANCFMRHT